MFERNWVNGLAVGLGVGIPTTAAVTLWLVGAIVPPEYFGSADYDANGDSQSQPSDNRWWWIGRVVYAEDTAAQWIMMAATIFAAFLLLRTLWATQKMARDTQKMALDTTRIGEAQVRAYIGPAGGKALRAENGSFLRNDEGVIFKAEVFIRNTGQSPARNICVNRMEKSVGAEILEGYEPDLANATQARDFSLGSGEAVRYEIENVISHESHEALVQQDMFVLLIGKITYRDVFGKGRTTRYCLKVEAFGTEREKIFPYGDYNYED